MTRLFDWPAGLELFPAVIGVALMILWSRRQRLARLSPWPRLREAARRNFSNARFVWTLVGLGFLMLAVAGPRWFTRTEDPFGPGRDLMIVLDMSRSMGAEQPTRAAKAIRSLRTLTDPANLPPGTRVGLVVFAATPTVVFPLTRDLDHLGWTLDRLAADDVPASVRGDPAAFVSGTRIGAALRLALQSLGESRAGQQDIVLLSDGDDPIDDDEWRSGITAARQAGVPVHVVAVGEPGAATIPDRDDVLRHDGAPVRTEVRRDRLDPIARATGGTLMLLPRGEVPIATTLSQRWSDAPSSAITASSGVSARRLPWVAAALVSLLLTLGFDWPHDPKRAPLSPRGEGPGVRGPSSQVQGDRAGGAPSVPPSHVPGDRIRWFLSVPPSGNGTLAPSPPASLPEGRGVLISAHLVRLLSPLGCLLLIAAADPPAGDTLVRQGDDAFQRRDFAAALDAFTRAQPLIGEPGLAAFNRAAAHFRLGHFPEAADAYRQALADAKLPASLRVRASYDLGNSLLASAADRPHLEEAMAAYRACLADRPDADLKSDAEHNLAIAGWRWLKVQPPKTDPGTDPSPKKEPKTGKEDTTDPKGSKLTPAKNPGDKVKYTDTKPPTGLDGDKGAATIGEITVLPDTTERVTLTPSQAARAVAEHAERIAAQRRREQSPRERPPTQGKDW